MLQIFYVLHLFINTGTHDTNHAFPQENQRSLDFVFEDFVQRKLQGAKILRNDILKFKHEDYFIIHVLVIVIVLLSLFIKYFTPFSETNTEQSFSREFQTICSTKWKRSICQYKTYRYFF